MKLLNPESRVFFLIQIRYLLERYLRVSKAWAWNPSPLKPEPSSSMERQPILSWDPSVGFLTAVLEWLSSMVSTSQPFTHRQFKVTPGRFTGSIVGVETFLCII